MFTLIDWLSDSVDSTSSVNISEGIADWMLLKIFLTLFNFKENCIVKQSRWMLLFESADAGSPPEYKPLPLLVCNLPVLVFLGSLGFCRLLSTSPSTLLLRGKSLLCHLPTNRSVQAVPSLHLFSLHITLVPSDGGRHWAPYLTNNHLVIAPLGTSILKVINAIIML